MCTGPNEFQYAAFVAGSRSDLLGNSVSEELPTTGYHTMEETASRASVESFLALLRAASRI